MDAHDTPTHCENCATPLQGGYCHRCGQSAVNPIRDTHHAIVERERAGGLGMVRCACVP